MTQTQLLDICLFFLGLEERALLQGRPNIARWARRMYERYRRRYEEVKWNNAGIETLRDRSRRPARI